MADLWLAQPSRSTYVAGTERAQTLIHGAPRSSRAGRCTATVLYGIPRTIYISYTAVVELHLIPQ